MYHFTQHIRKQMQLRCIDERLIGWCLAKGTIKPAKNESKRFRLNRQKLTDAVRSGAEEGSDISAVIELTVVVQARKLVTVFVRKGDTGMITPNQNGR